MRYFALSAQVRLRRGEAGRYQRENEEGLKRGAAASVYIV